MFIETVRTVRYRAERACVCVAAFTAAALFAVSLFLTPRFAAGCGEEGMADSSEEPRSAEELASQTEKFWRQFKRLDVTYRFTSYDYNSETKEYKEIVQKIRWRYDLETGQERETREDSIDELTLDWYFDGASNTYELRGIDVDSEMTSELDFFLRRKETRRSGAVYEGYDPKLGASWENHTYRTWYPGAQRSYFRMAPEDDTLSFVETVRKYPTSTPVRSTSPSGDILWTFLLFPSQEAADAYPNEVPNAQGMCYDEIVINESKNYLVQSVRSTFYQRLVSGEKERIASLFEVGETLKVGDFYFPKLSWYKYPEDDPRPQIHEVESLKVDGDLDFDSFKIPKFTLVSVFQKDGSEYRAIWGEGNKAARTFRSEEEYYAYMESLGMEYEAERKEAIEREKAERRAPRAALCALGFALIIAAFWMKRRKKAKTEG